MVISALPLDLQVRLRDVTGSETAPVTALFAPAHLALFAPEGLLRPSCRFIVEVEGNSSIRDTPN